MNVFAPGQVPRALLIAVWAWVAADSGCSRPREAPGGARIWTVDDLTQVGGLRTTVWGGAHLRRSADAPLRQRRARSFGLAGDRAAFPRSDLDRRAPEPDQLVQRLRARATRHAGGAAGGAIAEALMRPADV